MTKFEEMVFSTWLAENQDTIATSEMNRGPITAQLWTDDGLHLRFTDSDDDEIVTTEDIDGIKELEREGISQGFPKKYSYTSLDRAFDYSLHDFKDLVDDNQGTALAALDEYLNNSDTSIIDVNAMIANAVVDSVQIDFSLLAELMKRQAAVDYELLNYNYILLGIYTKDTKVSDDLSNLLDDETWIDYLTEDDTLYDILKEYGVLN